MTGIDREGSTYLYEQIADELRQAILAGQLPADRRIPTGSELMAEHHVSRMTARRALAILVAEGLVKVVPGRGAYVTERKDQVA